MSTSMEQVARLLSEIPYIEAHPGISVHEVAKVFGISEDTVKADIRVAIYCGLPGGYPSDLIDVDLDVMQDEQALYMNNPTPLGRPLKLSGAETASLQVALMAVRAVADDQITQTVDSLMAKIASGLTSAIDVRVSTGEERIREGLAQAIRAAERVELTYDGHIRGMTTNPVVDPVEITVRGGVAYVTAYDVTGPGWRTYRLDRISNLSETGQSAVDHPGKPDPDSWSRSLAAAQTVRVQITQDATWITEYIPFLTWQALPGGVIEVTLPVVDPVWLVRLLLALGDSVRRVEPATSLVMAQDLARQALDVYTGLGVGDEGLPRQAKGSWNQMPISS
ncbi:MAG: WYL domain-containing protein [Propionibacteriaceae bacterium]|nr:WYL domain-containing protein [Propionibacteriaceae bacterium]